MDLDFSPDQERFREDVRLFLKQRLPVHLAEKVRSGQRLTKQDHELWHAIVNERGWLASHWPKEHGGTGWDVVRSYIFDIETALANAPPLIPFGLFMLGPVLIEYGSEAQKARWLPRILDGSDWWCQGYSEPGAGSDLASLKTTAVRDGDCYVVNGQKTWTTLAQHANMIFCLVRTSTERKKQDGISFLLIDMATAGVEVRPIRLLDGEYEVNEVFFTDVRVPVENLVGEEGRGWTYAKYLLGFERGTLAGIGPSMAALDQLLNVARGLISNGLPLIQDPLFAARIARVQIELDNMKTTTLRLLSGAEAGASLGMTAMLKIRGTEIRQEITSLIRRALGPLARPAGASGDGPFVDANDAMPKASLDYFNNRKLTIFGGSNEIQREIIAKTVLEL